MSVGRRDFLQGLTGFGSAVALRRVASLSILQSLVHGLFTKTLAQSMGVDPRIYLDFHIGGGWPGQFLYAPYKPYAADAAHFNGNNVMISNNWVSGAPVYSTVAKTVAGTTLHLPPAWGPSLPRNGAPANSSTEVLKHTIFLRGIRNLFDSHDVGAEHSYRPGSGVSIAGAVADATDLSKNPIPATSFGDASVRYFTSKKYGTRLVSFGGSGPIYNLLSPFDAEASMEALLSRRDSFTQAFQSAVQAVAQDAALVRPGAMDILASVAGAEALVRQNFSQLESEFTTRRTIYETMISAVVGASGINQIITEAVNPAEDSPWRHYKPAVEGVFSFASNADLRSIITASTRVYDLARAFATADYLVQYGHTNAASFALSGLVDLNITDADLPAPITQLGNDQHDTGVGLSMVANNIYARCVLACLNEFIARAKSWNKFDNVVINLRSDFTRSPRADGSGHDHAWSANAMMLISGAIKTPQVIGNIYSGNTAGEYVGTYGNAAPNQHEGGQTILTMGHYATTVCDLLRVPSPTSNFESVVEESSSNGFVSKIGNGQIIPGNGS